MKDKILEIIKGGIEFDLNEHDHTFNDDCVAIEIADMVKVFVEWFFFKYKDSVPMRIIENDIEGEIMFKDEYEEYKTINQLFNYWYNNVKFK